MEEEQDLFGAKKNGFVKNKLNHKSRAKIHGKINAGEEDQMEVVGFRLNRSRAILAILLAILSLGIVVLVFYWRRHWRLLFTCDRCRLDLAEFILLKDQYGQYFVEKISSHSVSQTALPRAHSSVVYTPDPDELNNVVVSDERKWLCKYFVNKKIKYMWDSNNHNFVKLRGPEEGRSCSYFHKAQGLTATQQNEGRILYGENLIAVHVTPVVKLFVAQALNPFYIFQLFSCCLWIIDMYYWFAVCILMITFFSLTLQIFETRSTQRALKRTITSADVSLVCRGNSDEYETINSSELVPGDIIEIPRFGCVMQCDAVLVNGNCIVNESMLTGESVPVMKTPIPNPTLSGDDSMTFDIKEHSRHTLFCGTQVLQTRFYGNQRVRAVVIRTGFMTAKGELVRSILFPKPVDFKFTQDSLKFIGCLAMIAFIGMIYTVILMVTNGNTVKHIIVRTLDLVTIVIPPALPAAMTVGIVFAQKRLRRELMYCINPRCINMCGAINAFCFDKTGTMTEDGLDMWGVVPVSGEKFAQPERDVEVLEKEDPLLCAMATCHSLTLLDGELAGDPMDLKMFEATRWLIEETGEDSAKYDVFMPTIVKPKCESKVDLPVTFENNEEAQVPYEIGIIRQFTFSSKLQRMSVVTRNLGATKFRLFTKGSPEMVSSLCRPNTVPQDFQEVLNQYTCQGFRVLALAYRSLSRMNYVKVQRIQREQVECKLTFLGLLVLENQLKPETEPVIRSLQAAKIRTIMVTGDNMLTALSVARDSGMVAPSDRVLFLTAQNASGLDQKLSMQWSPISDIHDCPSNGPQINVDNVEIKDSTIVDMNIKSTLHIAVTGKSWSVLQKYCPEIIPKIIVFGTVFARFSPDQKQQLIEYLQQIGYYVGMCGDGANDCGALKAAHAGISLSEAEASVAAPFTSKIANITCVTKVIREGRAALVTSYGIFKYMACYSLTQFLAVCILYWGGTNFTDFTFLYIDLVLQTSLGITFCYTAAYPHLVPQPPRVSLLALSPILSIICQLLVNMAFQVFAWLYTRQQVWFEEYVPPPPEIRDYTCHEVTAVFSVSAFQFISMAISFSKGPPYRKSMFTNYLFLLNIAVCVVLTSYLVLGPFEWLAITMQLKPAPIPSYRFILLGMACMNFFAGFFVETYLIDLLQRLHKSCCRKGQLDKPKTQHQVIADELSSQQDWPPTLSSDSSHLSLAELLKMESGVNDDGDADTADGALDDVSDEGGSDCDESVLKETDLGLSRSSSKMGDKKCLLPVDDSLT